jgi:hypothetical protein
LVYVAAAAMLRRNLDSGIQMPEIIRREIADRVTARMRERGFAADQDCAFMNLIDDWTHLIDMAECRSRYAEIMRERRQARRNTRPC